MSLLTWIIVLIAVAIVLSGLILRWASGMFRLIVPVLLVGLLLGGGFWIYSDINDLRQHFYQDDKLFVLDIDGVLAGAFTLDDDGIPRPVADLRPLRQGYPDLAALQGSHYKVIVLTWPVVADTIALQDFEASARELRAALRSDNPKQVFIDKALGQFGADMLGQITKEADRLYPTDDVFASTIFAVLAQKALMHPDRMFEGLRQGTVRIYPETVTFKILKVLPEGFGSIVLPTSA